MTDEVSVSCSVVDEKVESMDFPFLKQLIRVMGCLVHVASLVNVFSSLTKNIVQILVVKVKTRIITGIKGGLR